MPYRKTYKRKYTPKKRMYKPRKTIKKSNTNFANAVMKVVNRKAETKKVFRILGGGSGHQIQLYHNNVTILEFNALDTIIGVRGEDIEGIASGGNRLGKKIYLRGISCAINLESIQKRPQVTYWIALIRNKPNPYTNLDTKGKIFEGLNSTIPMDYMDTDKVEVKFLKKIVLRAPNMGTSASMPASGFAPTWENAGDPQQKMTVTNPQKIEKFYIPFNRIIEYNDWDPDSTLGARPHPRNMWQWVAWSYDNHATPDTGADSETGRLEMTTVLKFTDV